jgi:hypothetical protein
MRETKTVIRTTKPTTKTVPGTAQAVSINDAEQNAVNRLHGVLEDARFLAACVAELRNALLGSSPDATDEVGVERGYGVIPDLVNHADFVARVIANAQDALDAINRATRS